jgi:hypothetical protein
MQVALNLSHTNTKGFNRFKNHADRIIAGNTTGTISYSYLFSLTGTLNWWGGVLAPNGKIYCIPRNNTAVRVIDTNDDSTYTFGNIAGTNKYWSAVLSGHYIYCCPWDATSILKIDTRTDEITTFGSITARKYYSAIVAQNGKIYFTPDASGTTTYLVLDPSNDTYEEITHSGTTYSYRSPVIAPNGKIYCPGAEFISDSMLVIDTNTNTDYNLDPAFTGFAEVGTAWQSGTIASNGKLYWVPRNDVRGLIVDPNTDEITYTNNISGVSPTAYFTTVMAADGKIYGIGQDNVEELCQIDTETDNAIVTGGVWTSGGNGEWVSLINAPNGSLYGVPNNASSVIKISFSGVTQGFNENFLMSGYYNHI